MLSERTFLLCAVVGCVLVVFLPGSAHGWGDNAHRITAEICQAQLSASALAAVNAQLPEGFDLPDIATWPDSYDHSDDGAWSEPLHYVDLYEDSFNFTYDVCFGEVAEYVGCVVTAVENFTAILKEEYQEGNYTLCKGDDNDPDGEPCPLSFFIHFLGDIHQPLHVAYASDAGGNQYSVDYMGDITNVHSVWDGKLLGTYEDNNDYDWWTISQQLLGWVNNHTAESERFVSNMDPAFWADESFELVRLVAYNNHPGSVSPATIGRDFTLPDFPIKTLNEHHAEHIAKSGRSASSSDCGCPEYNDGYYDRNIGVALRRMVMGGLRAAELLNEIYA